MTRAEIDTARPEGDIPDMSSLALEIDQALQRLDPLRASRLERLLRDGLALALGDGGESSVEMSANARRELFARRFAPLTAVPDRDLGDLVNENRGDA